MKRLTLKRMRDTLAELNKEVEKQSPESMTIIVFGRENYERLQKELDKAVLEEVRKPDFEEKYCKRIKRTK